MAQQPAGTDMSGRDMVNAEAHAETNPEAAAKANAEAQTETNPEAKAKAVPAAASPDAPPARRAGRAPVGRSLARVVAVFGPTASGKTAVAEAVADRLATEVVSADAMQVYRGLPILTNQPQRPTRLVAIRSLDEEMSLGAYASLAHAALDELVERHGTAVVAGGTGLYLRAALADLSVPPRAEPQRRARIEEEVDEDRSAAYRRLEALDPASAGVVHSNDRQRLVRALELAETGHSLAGGDRLWSTAMRLPTVVVGLEVPASVLEQRIRARTVEMFERGVVGEVRAALAGPVSRTAQKTLGLREIAELDEADALERVVVRTRRYAAYQRKWMRRIPGIVPIDGGRDPGAIADEIVADARL